MYELILSKPTIQGPSHLSKLSKASQVYHRHDGERGEKESLLEPQYIGIFSAVWLWMGTRFNRWFHSSVHGESTRLIQMLQALLPQRY